jgi:hypothetical protein
MDNEERRIRGRRDSRTCRRKKNQETVRKIIK